MLKAAISYKRKDVRAMKHREQLIQHWFAMWLTGSSHGIEDIFAEDCIYTESWGPEYHGITQIQHWFTEWNTRGCVLQWDIQRFFHSDEHTIVQWYFKNQMHNGNTEAFDGLSLIRWTADDKIASLKEFGCNTNTYDPYADGPTPRFRPQDHLWF